MEEKIELTVMDIALKYLTEYREYLDTGSHTYEAITPQLEELKKTWETKSLQLQERDTESELLAQAKGKVFGLHLDEVLSKEGFFISREKRY